MVLQTAPAPHAITKNVGLLSARRVAPVGHGRHAHDPATHCACDAAAKYHPIGHRHCVAAVAPITPSVVIGTPLLTAQGVHNVSPTELLYEFTAQGAHRPSLWRELPAGQPVNARNPRPVTVPTMFGALVPLLSTMFRMSARAQP